jgi:hypothetical protein
VSIWLCNTRVSFFSFTSFLASFFVCFLEDPVALVFFPFWGVPLNVGVLYIRNVRNLGPRGLKVRVGDALLEGLYHLDGRLRPRGLSSINCSIEGLVRARHMLLRSGMSDGALVHLRWSRECNDGGSGRHHRGNVSNVGVLLVLISLLGLAFASTFTALALGLAIVTLLLLVLLLLLVQPLLVVPVWVAALALHRTDLIGVVLI